MKKFKELKSSKSGLSFYVTGLVMIVFFAVLSYLFPYVHDDWAWGSSDGIERLKTFFDNYNGRYFGNFLILAISRSRLLKTVVMGISYFLTCLFCSKYSSDKKTTSLLFSGVLFLCIMPSIMAQAIVWTAGYANYVPSALLSFAYILIIKNITYNEAPTYSKYLFIGTFLIGFSAATFMENITLFNIALGVAVIFWSLLKFRKVYSAHVSFLVGAVIGAVWMFTNSAYHTIYNGDDGYRNVPKTFRGIVGICLDHGVKICDYTFMSNVAYIALFSILLIALTVLFINKTENGKMKFLARGAIVIHLMSTFMMMLCKLLLMGDGSPRNIYKCFIILVVGIYYLSIIAVILVCVEKGKRFTMLLPFYCLPVSVAPLLVINPIGPRCFFISNLFVIVLLVSLFNYITKDCDGKITFNKFISAVLSAVFLGQMIYYLAIFVPMYTTDMKRNEFAKLQSSNGEKTIVISSLPNSQYAWSSSPVNDLFEERYKNFYGIDEDADIIILKPSEFEKYYKNYNKQ